jgi:hypothetical protein
METASAVVISQLDEFEKPPTRTVEEAWAGLVSDRNIVRSVMRASKHHAQYLEQAFDSFFKLLQFGEVRYLLDFDVIRPYLERTLNKQDQLFIDSVIFDSRQPYMIPMGAFAELLDWLANDILTGHQLTADHTFDGSSTEAFQLIAKALGIDIDVDLGDSDDIALVFDYLEKRRVIVNRLLLLLGNPRFLGIASDHDPEDFQTLYSLLSNYDRPKHQGPRTLVDERDARNLAIAIKSAREATTPRHTGGARTSIGYILVTRTGLLLNLVRNALDSTHDHEPATDQPVSQLQKMLRMNEVETFDDSLIPVVNPITLVNAELLGVYDNDMRRLREGQDAREAFRTVGRYFEDRLTRLSKTQPDYALGTTPFMTSHDRQVMNYVIDLHKLINAPIDSGVSAVESRRASSAAIDLARDSQRGKKLDDVKLMSIELGRLVAQLYSIVDKTPGYGFRCDVQEVAPQFGFETFEIRRHPWIEDETPALFGDLLRFEPNKRYDRFEIRWPIVCTISTFAQSFLETIKPALDWSSDARTELDSLHYKRIDRDSPFRYQGVIIHTSAGAFGTSLGPFINFGLKSFDLPRIRLAVKSAIKDAKVANRPQDIDFELQQLRINTLFGDFVFDITNDDGEVQRFVIAISHLNLSHEIAKLFGRTTRYRTLMYSSESLANTLNDLLSAFPSADNFMERLDE